MNMLNLIRSQQLKREALHKAQIAMLVNDARASGGSSKPARTCVARCPG